ncbi:MAG: D-alanyl-D-alanine carboxypeptidase family protein [Bacillota bacterium]
MLKISLRKASAFLAIIIMFCLFLFPKSVAAADMGLTISAEAAVLLDWNSGRILYARKPHLPKPMASTTKIMTAILALEMGTLDELVVTSPRAASTGGSSIWLEEGEEKTLEELLYGLMLRSGNDAAVAIAEHIAGKENSFAEIMTRRARDLGARNTSFRNPHGLHHEEHYTTAYDLSLIAAHAMGISKFKEIITTDHIIISWPGHPWDRHLYNQNRLLEIYQGAEGIKTGWTTPAGRCFVGAATREGRRLVVVLLNAPQMWEDTIKLLDYGFDSFTYQQLIDGGQHLKTIPVLNCQAGKVTVMAARPFVYPMQAGEEGKVSYRFVVSDSLQAPLRAGERIGELEILFERELIGLVDLVTVEEVKILTLWQRIKRMMGRGV